MTRRRDPAADLAAEVLRASRVPGSARTLLLDLDGTLAPIADTPRAARVPTETLAVIGDLVRLGWSVAIVSGRPTAEVRAMVPVRGVRIFGSHGAEWIAEAGGPGPAKGVRSALRSLSQAAGKISSGIPGALVELKPDGVAFHDRAVAPDDLLRWRGRVRALLERSDLTGLEEIEGRRVLEIRPRGMHKGTVLKSFFRARPKRDASLVAVGDDRTDEDLFRALRGKGLGVRVGRPKQSTHAARRLPSPSAVHRFLAFVARATEASLRTERI